MKTMRIRQVIRFKACPRCKGDLCFEKHGNSGYEQCIQCGYRRYEGTPDRPIPEPARETREQAHSPQGTPRRTRRVTRWERQ